MNKLFGLALSCLLSATAIAEVQYVSENGFILENKIQVSQSAEEAWDVFVTEVDQWWPSDHTWWGESSTLSISAQAGGCFCENNGGRSAEHMRVVFVDPGRLLRMTGGLGPLQGFGMYGALDWTFTPNDQGTEISMKYSVQGISPDGWEGLAPIVDSVQMLQLGGLEEALN